MTKDPHRAPNFTHREVETLIYHLEVKPELIKPAARLNRDGNKQRIGDLTVNDKLDLWAEVAAEVNKVGESSLTGIVRSAIDLKKKWNDLKSRVKSKAEDIRAGKLSDKTPLSHLEERVLNLIAKTSNLQGLNGALPPAYLNVIGKRKKNKTENSSSESLQTEELEEVEPNIDSETNDGGDDIVAVKQKVHKLASPSKMPSPSSPSKMPSPSSPSKIPITRIPIITFTRPLSKIIQIQKEARNNNLGADSSAKEDVGNSENDSKDNDTQELLEMIYSSQKEIKNEMKSIKKIMIKMSEQKRKRIEQENEKIQLKKMKLMLKCQKQRVDYEELISDFM